MWPSWNSKASLKSAVRVPCPKNHSESIFTDEFNKFWAGHITNPKFQKGDEDSCKQKHEPLVFREDSFQVEENWTSYVLKLKKYF